MRDAGPLQPFLESGIGVLDGGLASELERRGSDLRDALWTAKVLLESPETIVDVHRAYFEAGADLAITASYQASEQGYAARGIDRRHALELLRLSVRLAQEARDRWLDAPQPTAGRPRPLVAASIGPYGAILADGSEYRGRYDISRAALKDFHAARLDPLVEAGPDLLAIETIPSALEAEAVVEALEDLGDPVPAWCTFTLRDGATLADGGALDDAMSAIAASRSIAAVGVNCSPPASAVAAVARIASSMEEPVVAYPNRGAGWDADAKAWTGAADVDMGNVAADLVAAGAAFVGGCCGTGPDDVRAIAATVGARSVQSLG